MKTQKSDNRTGFTNQSRRAKEYPIDLMAALINHFSTEPTVNAAYLRLIEQNGQKSYFIVVDFFGDMESTFDAISKVANPFLDDEIQLSMMPYSMDFAKMQ